MVCQRRLAPERRAPHLVRWVERFLTFADRRRDPPFVERGHGASFHNVRLGAAWRRTSDNAPLDLRPGTYTLRMRLSTQPRARRAPLAVSKPIQIEVIPTD